MADSSRLVDIINNMYHSLIAQIMFIGSCDTIQCAELTLPMLPNSQSYLCRDFPGCDVVIDGGLSLLQTSTTSTLGLKMRVIITYRENILEPPT